MSQCSRLLERLSDHEWHTTADLHAGAGFMIVHSRVSELRSRGHVIECEHVPGETGSHGFRYRWLVGGGSVGDGEPERQPAADSLQHEGSGASSADEPSTTPGRTAPLPHPTPCAPVQLTLAVAA